jgi:ABC-type Fe3+ transport system substrate-binding protein
LEKLVTRIPCLSIVFLFIFSSASSWAYEPLRVLSWEGYIQEEDIKRVDQLLASNNLPFYVEVIKPYAEGAEQMFDLIRGQYCDVSFLTLFFIKIEKEQTVRLLQPINTESPHLSQYSELLSSLIHLDMGLNTQGEPLYIPWGGGVYGFYADHKQLNPNQIPRSVKELWQPQWQGQFSLNKTQAGYNLGLALMSMDKSPFYLYDLIQQNKREQIKALIHPEGKLQKQLNRLYQNAGNLWTSTTEFKPGLKIVSSWGPEIQVQNQAGGDWRFIDFAEGHMAWLDTINFVKHLKGEKLAAAEIFANYFIGKQVQNRIANELSMVPALIESDENRVLGQSQQLYQEGMFVPPYDEVSYGIIKKMANMAEQSRQNSAQP